RRSRHRLHTNVVVGATATKNCCRGAKPAPTAGAAQRGPEEQGEHGERPAPRCVAHDLGPAGGKRQEVRAGLGAAPSALACTASAGAGSSSSASAVVPDAMRLRSAITIAAAAAIRAETPATL